jgi:predicted ribosome quality control (RQC) complex YloA/Tae2 family protein
LWGFRANGFRLSLSASEIAAVVAELLPLVGSRVDAVRVHAERALTLELFGRAGAVTLLLSAEPDLTRLHAVLRRPPAPPAPPPLQALLRRELEGARLSGVAARPGDRVVELSFETGAGPRRLVGELTGRHGNLFLVGADGLIRASAGRNLSQRRELVPGKPYLYPAERPAASASPAFLGLGLGLVQGASAGASARAPPAEEGERFPISAAIEARYRSLEDDRAAVEGRRRLREPVRAALARSARALEKLAEEAQRVPAAEEDRRRADLLKQNLHGVSRGAREALLTEWTAEGPRQVKVALDPALPARENMERYYRRYRRIVESAARVAARTGEVSRRREELGALLAEIDRARVADLPRLEREARRLGAAPRPPPRPRSRRDEPLPPYRLFRSLAGAPLLVGRNAAANDALTVKVARGNDLWLHARGRSGSHVVVKLDKGRTPDGETLLDAAHLAAHFSDARGEPQVDVVATRAKYVRKVKGAAPGAVTYSQERTLHLRVEPQRVERLLASEEIEAV